MLAQYLVSPEATTLLKLKSKDVTAVSSPQVSKKRASHVHF